MKEILQRYLTVLGKDRIQHRRMIAIVCVLSLCISGAVSWQLRFVGSAKADAPSCGMEEHVHTEECIERRLICGLKEGDPEPETTEETTEETEEHTGHHHGPECYEEVRTLTCTQPEHTHGDSCYKIEKVLDCGHEEHTHNSACYEIQDVLVCTEDHEHTADCYEQQEVLVCGMEEHTHTEDCYKLQKTLICEQPEHSHSDACYTVEKKLICGKQEGEPEETETPEETEEETTEETLDGDKPVWKGDKGSKKDKKNKDKPKGHVHTDECYEIVYICGKEEHKHTLACYSDPNADVESYKDWEATLPKKLGRNWNESVLMVAQSQMGYKESEKNFQPGTDGHTKMGYTRYGAWFGNPYGDWNTMFTSFCLRYAGIPNAAVPRHAGAFAMSVKLQELGIYMDRGYAAKPGDVVFLRDEGFKNVNRTAVVAAVGNMIVDGQKVPCITIIEGDRENAVAPYKYALNDAVIQGYLSLEAAYKRAEELDLLEGADIPATTDPKEETDNETVPAGTEEQGETVTPETTRLLEALEDKARAYQKAAKKKNNDEKLRKLAEDMNLLYDQAKVLYVEANPHLGEEGFGAYMQANYESCLKAMTQAENLTGNRALDGMLSSKLNDFSQKAKDCAIAMDMGNKKEASQLKLQLDQLYFEMEDLHAKRYPDAAEGSFDIFLNNNHSKAVKRYLAAVKAFPDVQLEGYVTFTDPVTGELRRVFKMQDGTQVDVSLQGSICFPVVHKPEVPVDTQDATSNLETVSEDKAVVVHETAGAESDTGNAFLTPEEAEKLRKEEEEAEKNAETEAAETQDPDEDIMTLEEPVTVPGWDKLEVQVKPVSDQAEKDFTDYITRNHPDAMSMTMLDLAYSYEGQNLDLGGTRVRMTITPSADSLKVTEQVTESADGEVKNAGPVIRNAPIADTTTAESNAEDSMDEDVVITEEITETAKTEAAGVKTEDVPAEAEPVTLVVLERNAKGEIRQVAEMTYDGTEETIESLEFQVVKGAAYAVGTKAEPLALNEKPVLDHPQWADVWGSDMQKDLVDAMGNKVPNPDGTGNQIFMLRTDPYFQNPPQDFKHDFPIPQANLRYVMSNYNYFIYDDAVATTHLVGSLIIKGNAYLSVNPGGTGSGYGAVLNDAPSYYKGRLIRTTDFGPGKTDETKLDPMNCTYHTDCTVNDSTLQAMWYNYEAKRMPTYLGNANKDGAVIKTKSNDGSTSKTETFKGQALKSANACDQDGKPVDEPSPYYYTEEYIRFEDFWKQMYSEPKILHPKGITVKKPTPEEQKNMLVETHWQLTNDDLMRDGYQWVKCSDGHLKLFVVMGNIYDVDDLENVQIIFYPYDGFEGFSDKSPVTSPALRAGELCTKPYNTVITSDATTANMYHGDGGTFAYYTHDYTKINPSNQQNPEKWDATATSNASLANTDKYTTSSMILLPNAEDVHVRLSATHVIAPKAKVKVGKGDYYGCFVCNQLRSIADHHILPYDGKSVMKPMAFEVSKMMDDGEKMEDGTPAYRAPTTEVYNFTVESAGFYKRLPDLPNGAPFDLQKQPFCSQIGPTPVPGVDQLTTSQAVNTGSKVDLKAVNDKVNAYMTELFKIADRQATGKEEFQNQATWDYSPYKGMYMFKITEDDVPAGDSYMKDERVFYIGLEVGNENGDNSLGNLQGQKLALKKPVFYAPKEDGTGYEQVSNIIFINTKDLGIDEPLPKTGGIGILPFMVTGFAFTIIPIFFVFNMKRKERR